MTAVPRPVEPRPLAQAEHVERIRRALDALAFHVARAKTVDYETVADDDLANAYESLAALAARAAA